MKDKEFLKRRKLYLIRVVSLFMFYLGSVLFVNLILNYIMLGASYIKDWAGTLKLIGKATQSVSTDRFLFDPSFLIFPPSSIPWWVSLFIALFLTLIYGWRIVRKCERLIQKIKLDYYYKEVKGSSRWANMSDISKHLTVVPKNKLDQMEKTGTLMGEDKDNFYIDTTTSHSLAIGTTRSGKTECFVKPNINILSSGLNPVNIISLDTKNGEVLSSTYTLLKSRGYRIYTMDYRNPLLSSRRDPLAPAVREYKKQMLLPKDEQDFSALDDKISLIPQILIDQPGEKKIWTESPAQLLIAIIYYLLEIGYEHGTIDELNMYTVTVFFINKASTIVDEENSITELDRIFQRLDSEHPAKLAYATSEFAKGEMKSSIQACLSSNLRVFTDRGIMTMTSGNDFDFSVLGDPSQLTALFVIVPEDKKNRHPLAVLSIMQGINELSEMANKQYGGPNGKKGALERPVYVLWDEWGNYSRLPNITTILTVAAGRNILFQLYAHNYAQIEEKYGRVTLKALRGGIANFIYILSSDLDTNKEMSEMLGKGTKEYMTQNGEHGSILESGNSMSHLEGVPLKTADELWRSEMWEIITIRLRCFPIQSKMTPFFKYGYEDVELEDMILDNKPRDSNRPISSVMKYDYDLPISDEENEDWDSEPIEQVSVLQESAPEVNIVPIPIIKENKSNMRAEKEFQLTHKVNNNTNSGFSTAIDNSDYDLAHTIILEQRDLGYIAADELEMLREMLTRYETQELSMAGVKDF